MSPRFGALWFTLIMTSIDNVAPQRVRSLSHSVVSCREGKTLIQRKVVVFGWRWGSCRGIRRAGRVVTLLQQLSSL